MANNERERVDSEFAIGDELFDDRFSTVPDGGGPSERYTVSRSIGVAVMRAGVPMQPEIPVLAAPWQISRAAALLATLSGLGQAAHAVELRPGDILIADSFANSRKRIFEEPGANQ